MKYKGNFLRRKLLENDIRQLLSVFLTEHVGSETFKTFYKPIEDITDYGFCCHVNAYLNFDARPPDDAHPLDDVFLHSEVVFFQHSQGTLSSLFLHAQEFSLLTGFLSYVVVVQW